MGTESLLTDYVENGSERAFRELVAAYISLVFSTALRLLNGDRQLAEDVCQTVFLDLANKAHALPVNVRLGGWLHRHTCFVARKALRRETRRKKRELQAVELRQIEDYTEENMAKLGCVLDEAINALGKEDRIAIVLRYFEERDFRSLGKVLGSSEDAARMRVSRAIDKLGALLRKRGLVLSISGLGFVLSGKTTVTAPVALAATCTRFALSNVSNTTRLLFSLQQACMTKLNLGIVGSAVALSITALLFASHAPQSKPSLSSGKSIEVARITPDEPPLPQSAEANEELAAALPAVTAIPVRTAITTVTPATVPVAISKIAVPKPVAQAQLTSAITLHRPLDSPAEPPESNNQFASANLPYQGNWGSRGIPFSGYPNTVPTIPRTIPQFNVATQTISDPLFLAKPQGLQSGRQILADEVIIGPQTGNSSARLVTRDTKRNRRNP